MHSGIDWEDGVQSDVESEDSESPSGAEPPSSGAVEKHSDLFVKSSFSTAALSKRFGLQTNSKPVARLEALIHTTPEKVREYLTHFGTIESCHGVDILVQKRRESGELLVTCKSHVGKATYEMKQKHNWFVGGPDGSAFTLLAVPIAASSTSIKDIKSTKTNLKAMVNSTPAMIDKFQTIAVTTVYQLHKGEDGTTRVVVVCRIEEGIADAREAKEGECGMGVGAGGWMWTP